MDRSYVDRNKATRERLAALLAATPDAALEAPIDGWSGKALVAHLAFWDRMVKLRWEHAAINGLQVPAAIDSTTTDFINDGQIPEWTAIPAHLAKELALAAAEACDQHVASLPDASVEAADNGPLYRLLDRSVHRSMHLDSLEAGLAAHR
jgi:hypothetical protein